MNVQITSGRYEIVDSGSAISYGEYSDITFHFKGDDVNGICFTLVFKNDFTSKMRAIKELVGNRLILNCINFNPMGAGTCEPILFAQHSGQILYMKFWTQLLGNEKGKEKTRIINYTFFKGTSSHI